MPNSTTRCYKPAVCMHAWPPVQSEQHEEDRWYWHQWSREEKAEGYWAGERAAVAAIKSALWSGDEVGAWCTGMVCMLKAGNMHVDICRHMHERTYTLRASVKAPRTAGTPAG